MSWPWMLIWVIMVFSSLHSKVLHYLLNPLKSASPSLIHGYEPPYDHQWLSNCQIQRVNFTPDLTGPFYCIWLLVSLAFAKLSTPYPLLVSQLFLGCSAFVSLCSFPLTSSWETGLLWSSALDPFPFSIYMHRSPPLPLWSLLLKF